MTKSSDQAKTAYLKRAFALNPVWQASDVMELRSRALKRKRLNKAKDVARDKNSQSREAARNQITRMQKQFWKLPMDDLRRQLEAMSAQSLPEFTPVINRLKTTAMARGEFPRLAQETWMDNDLFNAFKAAVVLPPTEASMHRERFTSRIRNKQHLKAVKTSVKQLQLKYPILYTLERDWFQTLMKQRMQSSRGGEGGGFSLPEMEWPIVIGVVIIVRILVRAIMLSGN